MISVCCFIVCINLLYSFVQTETFSRPKTRKVLIEEQKLIINSITAENQDEYLAKTVTPYWNLTYDKQLEMKQNSCSAIIDMIVKSSGNLKNLMTYKILPVFPSPVTEAYRNNDEFHISHGVDGNPKTVGCIFGRFSLGSGLSIHPTKIVTIKESHKRVAQVYEDFIRLSPLPATIKPYDGGHWNTLLVRSNEAGEIMACVTIVSRGYSHNIILEQKQALKEYFSKHLPNISLFHQVCPKNRCTHKAAPFILLYGNPYLMETLCGYKFSILPETFFPKNKLASKQLYDTIIKTAKLKPNTTVLDLCSGKGLNSIMVSKFVRDVFGLETVVPAVREAQHTAKINNIHNVKFMKGRVGKNLIEVLHNQTGSSDVVAILNHRGNGLGLDIINTIRSSFKISTILYFSFKSESRNAVQNIIDLCSYGNSDLPPFRLTKVIPFDLLPQTAFVELILMFQREPTENVQSAVYMYDTYVNKH